MSDTERKTKGPAPPKNQEREERLAARLRENLRKRKQQRRERQSDSTADNGSKGSNDS